jgi:hypothetical protein
VSRSQVKSLPRMTGRAYLAWPEVDVRGRHERVDGVLVVHHRRGTGEEILTPVLRGGLLSLDPPGVELSRDAIVAAGEPGVPEPEEGTA